MLAVAPAAGPVAAVSVLAGCVAEKVLTYAGGRGFSATDQATLKAVTDATTASGKGFRGLFASAAVSEAFRSRRAVGE